MVRRVLALGSAEPESEYPPRFAQALGSLGLLLGVALFAAGYTTLGWVPVVGVVVLQTLLAVSGFNAISTVMLLITLIAILVAQFLLRRAAAAG